MKDWGEDEEQTKRSICPSSWNMHDCKCVSFNPPPTATQNSRPGLMLRLKWLSPGEYSPQCTGGRILGPLWTGTLSGAYDTVWNITWKLSANIKWDPVWEQLKTIPEKSSPFVSPTLAHFPQKPIYSENNLGPIDLFLWNLWRYNMKRDNPFKHCHIPRKVFSGWMMTREKRKHCFHSLMCNNSKYTSCHWGRQRMMMIWWWEETDPGTLLIILVTI